MSRSREPAHDDDASSPSYASDQFSRDTEYDSNQEQQQSGRLPAI